jgi:hypothetical protein
MTTHKHLSPEDLPGFIDPSPMLPPRFRLLEVAILCFESEDGEICEDLIQVVGVIWNPKLALVSGWWYHIRYLNQPTHSPSLGAGFQEDCREGELMPLSISSV